MNANSAAPGAGLARVVTLAGTPREMGFQQGHQFRREIHAMYHALTTDPMFLALKPKLVPRRVFTWLATRVSAGTIKKALARHLPAQWAFVEGLAEGCGLSLAKLLFLQAIDALGTRLPGFHVPDVPTLGRGESGRQCSAAGVTRARTRSGKPLIVKNWDGPEMLAEHLVFRHVTPADPARLAHAGSGVCALAGTNNGMNDAGLAVVYNYAYPLDIGKRGIPAMFLIREALETCRTTTELVQLFEDLPRLGGATFMVGDATGALVVVESAPGRLETRDPRAAPLGVPEGASRTTNDPSRAPPSPWPGPDALVMTNHYLTPALRAVEVPREAVYNASGPAGFEGEPVHASSLHRYADAARVLREVLGGRGAGGVGVNEGVNEGINEGDDMDLDERAEEKTEAGKPAPLTREFLYRRVQCNHGPRAAPSGLTFCNHGAEISTGFGVLCDVGSKTFNAVVGHPCENPLRELVRFQ